MKSIKVKSTYRKYSVAFISNLKTQIEKLIDEYETHLIIDQNVYNLYKNDFVSINRARTKYTFHAVERKKNLTEIHLYLKFLLENKIKKNHKIVVIGGGLVQDIGSFTAHILLRGVNWIFIPTTLLAMTDSCIGSKSGINIGKYKNQLGSFNPPSQIYIYSSFLKSLPKNEILNGIGEVAKHGLIKGGKTYANIKNKLQTLLNREDMMKVEKVIYESLLIKKEIIEEDELETKGIRKLLNYGHSFGHALEGYTKNKIPHGIAVTIGIDMANFISSQRGILITSEFKEISNFLRNYIPYKKLKIDNLDSYMNFLSRDKKIIGNELSALLCEGIGKIKIVRIKLDSALRLQISNYLNYFNS